MAEFGAKMDWEGGFYDFIVGYGVDIEELPDDMDPDTRQAIISLKENEELYRLASDRLYTAAEGYDPDA